MHDLVIRGGLVVDGTGEVARVADVAVRDRKILEVGVVNEKGREEIDAEGAIVTPGFVDIHTHFDGQVTWDPELSPSSWHGVTTAVTGNCGVGLAPVRPGQEDDLAELMESVEMEPIMKEVLASYDRTFPPGDPPRYEPDAGDSIAGIATRSGVSPEEVLYDAVLEDDGRAFLLRPIQNYSQYSLDPAHAMLTHPSTVVGLADGGAHCAQICDTSSPTFMLTHWARDRKRGDQIPLERAVKSLTADTAALYGLGDRGIIAPGMKADLNVIDHAALEIGPPQLIADFPGGGSSAALARVPTRLSHRFKKRPQARPSNELAPDHPREGAQNHGKPDPE